MEQMKKSDKSLEKKLTLFRGANKEQFGEIIRIIKRSRFELGTDMGIRVPWNLRHNQDLDYLIKSHYSEIYNYLDTIVIVPEQHFGYVDIGIMKRKNKVLVGYSGDASKRDYLHIGNLSFIPHSFQATINRDWFVSVYGRKYLQKLRNVAKQISKSQNIKVKVNLESEKPKYESYDTDGVHDW